MYINLAVYYTLSMDITIIGTGRMAMNLGAGWKAAGHSLIYGSQSKNSVELPGEAGSAPAMSHGDALQKGKVIVLAIPYGSVASFAREHAKALRDRLVIDISNPFASQPQDGRSGAQVTADAIGDGARVAAAFKTNFAGTLLHPVDASTGATRDVFYASDQSEKATMEQLILDLNFVPVYCGTIEQAVVLDLMVPLIMALDSDGEGNMQAFFKVFR